ncbi:NHLP bacteriocin system secretion protein [Janthinobacterium fluminis]|uniref:NHLP bacteriocin system secretion protein n=1 Tax=Janthinobacterium fluminis TaxID=2987524 RepID=A0ABT5K0W3_9BURK|nr:NHLP bacteriocin system secretion protein [Janthinobacterium fluminis]MDC8758310.1 NHLP bacteriocin system secretion protein [Janthinobacterium fluminis]
MVQNTLFRQVALDRLSSPEELDSLLQVTSAKAWLALSGIGIVLAATVLWSLMGTLPTKLLAQQCILVKSGGVNIVTTSASGRLSDLSVEVGDTVGRGQIIGRVEQYELQQKIKASEARLKEVQSQYEQALALAGQSGKARAASRTQQAQGGAAQLAAALQRAKLLAERIESQAGLLEQGLITKQTLINTQLELASAQLEAATAKSQLKQLEVTALEEKKLIDNEVVLARNQVDDMRRTVASLVREAKNATLIVSPYAGRVLELKAVEGQLVERGSPLVSVESSGADINEIEAYIYLPADEGKKIKSGMRVEISPSTAKREEFGFLPALITSVADYPSTDQGLMRVFGNEKVVRQLTGVVPPIQILASLKPSPDNASRYEWSTRKGPPFSIQSGTLCSASIALSAQRPITLVMPVLKKSLGID